MLLFMLTCVTCTSDVTSLGWGWGCYVTFMLTCVTCTSDVTSRRLGGGDVNVLLRLESHAHLTLRHGVWGVGMLTFI